MHADVDDASIRGAVEKPRYTPRLICKEAHDLQTHLLHTGKCLAHIVNKDRNIRVDRHQRRLTQLAYPPRRPDLDSPRQRNQLHLTEP